MHEDFHDQAESRLNTLLDQARNGPTDNKRVVDAMLKSGSGRQRSCPHPTVNEASMESLIGSIIGGTSLKRSNSADKSEVTTIDYTVDSSQASMTTCYDRGMTWSAEIPSHNTVHPTPFIACNQNMGSISNIFRATASSHAMPSVPNQEMYRTIAIDDRQPTEQSNIALQPRLPAGWKVRWSNTKQKPYWVHPDFGSTWYCPGLLVNEGYEANRNELFSTDRFFQTTYQNVPNGGGADDGRNNDHDHIIRSFEIANHNAQFMQEGKKSVMSRTYDSHNLDDVDVSCMAKSAQMSERDSIRNIDMYNRVKESTEDDDAKEKTLMGANSSSCLDVSSVEISSMCLTQEFELSSAEASYSENRYLEVVDIGNDEVEHEYDDDVSRKETNEEGGDVAERSNNDDYDNVSDSDDAQIDGKHEVHSIVSDHVDVNALLNQRRKFASPLSSINEILRGSRCQSSEVSLDSSSTNNYDGLTVEHSNSYNSFEDSNQRSEDDKSASDDDNNIDVENAGVSTDIWEASNQGGFESDDYDLDLEQEKEMKASLSRGRKKYFFPPGPLCSLQFLEEIERKEFDSPLWRRMKRKRSTLSSVKAKKARQRQRLNQTF
jgi:hypothetical protein